MTTMSTMAPLRPKHPLGCSCQAGAISTDATIYIAVINGFIRTSDGRALAPARPAGDIDIAINGCHCLAKGSPRAFIAADGGPRQHQPPPRARTA